MKHKIISICFLLCLGLTACQPEQVPNVPEAAAPEEPETGSVNQQIKLIAEQANAWIPLGNEFPIHGGSGYAVTDLDGNGRLELIAAWISGTGHHTTAYFYEVDETCTTLLPCVRQADEGEPLADILFGPEGAYYSAATGITYYVYEDFSKTGPAPYPNFMAALWLRDGEVHTLTLAAEHAVFRDDGTLDYVSITDREGTQISKDEYAAIGERYFADCQKLSVTFGWLNLMPDELSDTDYAALEALLLGSYEGFSRTLPGRDAA